MADFSSRVMVTSDDLAGKATPPVLAGNWEAAGGMDQITVVRIDDTHIAEEQVKGDGAGYYEVEYSLPPEEEEGGEEEEEEEEEEDGVYVIEYSNPEEEGESYQFTMSVLKHPEESARAPAPPKPSRPRQRRRQVRGGEGQEEEEEGEGEEVEEEEGRRQLLCSLCPPPGKLFKRASGLAVHLKQMHRLEGKKTFYCPSCRQSLRTQVELDAHTRRHANQDAVFTCPLCSGPGEAGEEVGGFRGSRWGLRRHLEKLHPGVVPRCQVCDKGFKSLASYLADQFRHVGVSPFYCPECQIYEMTERGLSVHVKNHDRKRKRQRQQLEEEEEEEEGEGEELGGERGEGGEGGEEPTTLGVPASADNSATDDSDF